MSESESSSSSDRFVAVQHSGALEAGVNASKRDMLEADSDNSTAAPIRLSKDLAKAVQELEEESRRAEVEVFEKQDNKLEQEELERAKSLRSLKTYSAKLLGQRIQLQSAVCGPLFGLLPPSTAPKPEPSPAVNDLYAAVSKCEQELNSILSSFLGLAGGESARTECPSDTEWNLKDSGALLGSLTTQVPDIKPSSWGISEEDVNANNHQDDDDTGTDTNVNSTTQLTTTGRHLGLSLRRYRKTKFADRDPQWTIEDRLWQEIKRRRVCEAMDQMRHQIAKEEFAVLNQKVSKQTEDFMKGLDFCRSFAASQSDWKPSAGIGQEVVGQTMVYDDVEYYSFLLRRFVKGDDGSLKPSTASANAISSRLHHRRTPSTRSKEDRKLSKGRRLKLDPIPSLKGFMTPMEGPEDEIKGPPRPISRLLRAAAVQ